MGQSGKVGCWVVYDNNCCCQVLYLILVPGSCIQHTYIVPFVASDQRFS